MTSTVMATSLRQALRKGTAALLATAGLTAALAISAPQGPAAAVSNDDWLGVVNTYRAMSGLDPVSSNATWSEQAYAHSCYMLLNGITHYEVAGRPGYTSGGKLAGENGNVAVSSSISASPRSHIDLWMTGPFHAIGVMRHNLRSTGFGLCASNDTPTPWRSGATLDVLRGLDGTPRPASPVLFPGNGATVPLHSFITESPNPMTMCGWSGSAGLPLFALMPNDVTTANASLSGPTGPIEVCVLHKGNTSDATARAILDGDNGVVVMPRVPLADGVYQANVNSNGGSAAWSFTVNRNAALGSGPVTPPPPPVDATPTSGTAKFEPVAPFRLVDSRIGQGATRLPAGGTIEIPVTTDPNVVAVSANFVSTDAGGHGFLTTYNCTAERPGVSTLGYRPGAAVANQAFVPLRNGKMCVFSLAESDVVIDINGYYRATGGAGFTPIAPVRLLDTRDPGNLRLSADAERPLTVRSVSPGAPSTATAVAINLTAINADWYGYVRVYPCGAASGSEISSINFTPSEVRANTVVTPIAENGTICVQASTGVDVAIDLLGYFEPAAGRPFQPLSPVRLFDSRLAPSALNEITGGETLLGGQTIRLRIAGRQGVPATAKAASVNLTVVDTGAATHITAFPCGARPLASNVNIAPGQQVTANGAMVKLSPEGDVCLYTLNPVHLIVDINGVWL